MVNTIYHLRRGYKNRRVILWQVKCVQSVGNLLFLKQPQVENVLNVVIQSTFHPTEEWVGLERNARYVGKWLFLTASVQNVERNPSDAESRILLRAGQSKDQRTKEKYQ